MAMLAGGLVLLSFVTTSTPLPFLYVSLLPMMAGMASTMSPFTAMIMTSVPPERAGMGSATNDTTRELGGALGVAVLGSVFFQLLPGHGFADSIRTLIVIGLGCYAVSFAAAFLLPKLPRTEGADAA